MILGKHVRSLKSTKSKFIIPQTNSCFLDEQVLKELLTEFCVLRKLNILLGSLFEEFLALKNHLSSVLLKDKLQGRIGYLIRRFLKVVRLLDASVRDHGSLLQLIEVIYPRPQSRLSLLAEGP